MVLALAVIAVAQGVILIVQGVLFTLVLRNGARIDALADRITDLRVDVARIEQKLDDHIADPRAHFAA